MSESPRLDLGRPRQTGELLREALLVFFRQPLTLLGIGAAIVVPVEVVVLGIGLEQFSAPYSDKVSTAELSVSSGVSYFVVAPLVTAAMIKALADIAGGERARVSTSLQAGFDAFTPVLIAVGLAALGTAVGLLALIVPGIYLFVRWYFVPQTVVLDGERGPRALARSTELVHGSWWRVAGVVLLANFLLAAVSLLLLAPVEAAAKAADRQLAVLAGTVILDIVTVTYLAVLSTLLFHDLRARKARGFTAG